VSSVDPRYIATFQDWADFMYPSLEKYGEIVQIGVGDDWQSWASGLLSLNGIAVLGAPNPYIFDDWREWAARLVGLLNEGF
jgi:hypothetical protein